MMSKEDYLNRLGLNEWINPTFFKKDKELWYRHFEINNNKKVLNCQYSGEEAQNIFNVFAKEYETKDIEKINELSKNDFKFIDLEKIKKMILDN